MKKYIKIISIVFLSVLLLSGCSILGLNKGTSGKASAAEDKQKDKIEAVNKEINRADQERLTQIGGFSYGVQYALEKIPNTNSISAVGVAYELNTRIISLANQPSLEAIKEMQTVVNNLLTNNAMGKKLLEKKDLEIRDLQDEIAELKLVKEKEIQKYIDLANKTAAQADQYKATLGEMDKWFGLGAVWYGLKKFITTSLWILLGGSIIFLVLRFASMTNPAASAVFSIFNLIGSWVVHGIQLLVPKAAELAGNTATSVFNAYKSTMTKIVDAIQMAKTTSKASGKDPVIGDVLTELEKSMNDNEKAIVDDIKKSLNWK